MPVNFVTLDDKSPSRRLLTNFEKLETDFEKGVDSDGEQGPYVNQTVAKLDEFYKEEELPELVNRVDDDDNFINSIIKVNPADIEVVETIDDHLTNKKIDLMKISEVKDELQQRGEKVSGNKKVLQDRLKSIKEKK